MLRVCMLMVSFRSIFKKSIQQFELKSIYMFVYINMMCMDRFRSLQFTHTHIKNTTFHEKISYGRIIYTYIFQMES